MKLRILAVSLFLLSAAVAVGQVLYGTLVGAVTDPQQAAIIGANVSLKNNATGYAVEKPRLQLRSRVHTKSRIYRPASTTSRFRPLAFHRSKRETSRSRRITSRASMLR